MDDNEDMNRIRVIVCRPKERAEVVEIEEELKPMEEIVGGQIQEYMPFLNPKNEPEDERIEDIAIICDMESKLKEKEWNRAIRDENGEILDVIAGTFFICYAPLDSERFQSLPADLEREFLQKFLLPERFISRNGFNQIQKFDPLQIGDMRDYAR